MDFDGILSAFTALVKTFGTIEAILLCGMWFAGKIILELWRQLKSVQETTRKQYEQQLKDLQEQTDYVKTLLTQRNDQGQASLKQQAPPVVAPSPDALPTKPADGNAAI